MLNAIHRYSKFNLSEGRDLTEYISVFSATIKHSARKFIHPLWIIHLGPNIWGTGEIWCEWGENKISRLFLDVFVIYTIIVWGRQQIWKLRLWELRQLAQDHPAVKCKWNPCLTLFIALCVGSKHESMDEWVWEGSGTVFWAPPVYLFTIVFPDLGTVLASQEELNKYLLLNE